MSSAEIPSPYGSGNSVAHPSTDTRADTAAGSSASSSPAGTTGGQRPGAGKRIRTHHLQQVKDSGGRFAMLTAYEQYAAQIFDEAGVEVLLVGDSAANNVYGHSTTLPVTLDEMIPLCRAVSTAARRSFVVADLPFGSYEVSPAQAIGSSVRLMKEGLVSAVKMEGGSFYAEHVRAMVAAGIPVMAHIGFTPQSEHALGGYRIQGKGDAGQAVIDDAAALAEAGAFCVLMEMVPAHVAAAVDKSIRVPTIGIGAGNATTGQVLVWQDMMGLRNGKSPRFVKQYADLRNVMSQAAATYAQDVRDGTFPGPEHSF